MVLLVLEDTKCHPVVFREDVRSVVHFVCVAELQIVKVHDKVGEERPRMPGPHVELKEARALHFEHLHAGRQGRAVPMAARGRAAPVFHDARRCHSDVPGPVTGGPQALRHAGVVRDPVEGQSAAAQAHDVEARNALAQLQLRVVAAEQLPVRRRSQHLSVRREGFWCGFDCGKLYELQRGSFHSAGRTRFEDDLMMTSK